MIIKKWAKNLASVVIIGIFALQLLYSAWLYHKGQQENAVFVLVMSLFLLLIARLYYRLMLRTFEAIDRLTEEERKKFLQALRGAAGT